MVVEGLSKFKVVILCVKKKILLVFGNSPESIWVKNQSIENIGVTFIFISPSRAILVLEPISSFSGTFQLQTRSGKFGGNKSCVVCTTWVRIPRQIPSLLSSRLPPHSPVLPLPCLQVRGLLWWSPPASPHRRFYWPCSLPSLHWRYPRRWR